MGNASGSAAIIKCLNRVLKKNHNLERYTKDEKIKEQWGPMHPCV